LERKKVDTARRYKKHAERLSGGVLAVFWSIAYAFVADGSFISVVVVQITNG